PPLLRRLRHAPPRHSVWPLLHPLRSRALRHRTGGVPARRHPSVGRARLILTAGAALLERNWRRANGQPAQPTLFARRVICYALLERERLDSRSPTRARDHMTSERSACSRYWRTSEARNRRWPPRVRMAVIFPDRAQRVTVFGFTRKSAATSEGVRSASGA